MCHINSFVFAAFTLLLIQATRGLKNSGNSCHGGLYNWPFCNALDRSTRDDVKLENLNRSFYRELIRPRDFTSERRVFDLNRINPDKYSPPKSRSLYSFSLQNRRSVERVDSRRERANDRAFKKSSLETRRTETRESRREANDRGDESRRNIRDRLYDRQLSRGRRVTDENQRLTRAEVRDSLNEVARDSVNGRLVERQDVTRRENREYSRTLHRVDSRVDYDSRLLSKMNTWRFDSRQVEKREKRASSESRSGERRGENIRSGRRNPMRDEDNYRGKNRIRETRERTIYFERLENNAVLREENQEASRLSRTRIGSRLSQLNILVRGERHVRERESIRTLTDVNNMERSRIALRTRQIKMEGQVPYELTFEEGKGSTKDVLINVTRVVCFIVMALQIYLAGRSTKTKQRFLSVIPFLQSMKLKEE